MAPLLVRVAPPSASLTLLRRWIDPTLYEPAAKVTVPPPPALQRAMAALMSAELAPAATGQVAAGKAGSLTAAGVLKRGPPPEGPTGPGREARRPPGAARSRAGPG